MNEMVKHVIVHGRVQSVGFRAFVEGVAEQRGLEGWVRNRRDGSVEAVFAGDSDAVEATIAACRRGPPHARVDKVDERAGTQEDLALSRERGFVCLPTV